jgi:hypothetical protein
LQPVRTEDALEAWQVDSEKMASGRRMGANLPDARNRTELIARLKKERTRKKLACGWNASLRTRVWRGGGRSFQALPPSPKSGAQTMDRRGFLNLAAVGGGAVFASGLAGCASRAAGMAGDDTDFYFVQLSDTHWGYNGPANPDAGVTLRKAVATVNTLSTPPEFIVFTGDLTHTTDDPVERRRRLAEFKTIVADLQVRNVHFMAGEHDASLDRGAAYKEIFGETHYSFDYKGVHFIAIDNVSDPGAKIGDEQMAWLAADLKQLDKKAPIVVLTHRPLFDLAPKWDWATRDGAQAIELLMPYENVTVFYGHIHQEHHQMTGHIAHHSAQSLIFALPAPASQPNRTPLPWDPALPYKGLGFREVVAEVGGKNYKIQEMPVARA